MSSGPRKVAILGGGHVADTAHLPALARLPGRATVVAVCSRDVQKAQQLAAKHGVPQAFADPAELYRTCPVDVVIICAPNYLHHPLTLQALAHGCHVLCEKPPALTGPQAREMAAAAARRGLMLGYNFQMRQSSEYQLLKRCQTEGLLGDVYHINAQFQRRRGIPGWGSFTDQAVQGGGALLDLGVHVVDLAMDLLKYDRPNQILANTYDYIGRAGGRGLMGAWDPSKFTVEDAGVAHLAFAGNRSVSLTAAFALNQEADKVLDLQVYGTRGGATLFPFRLHTELAGELADIAFPFIPAPDRQLANTTAFLDACDGRLTTLCTAEEGARLQELMDRIYASAAETAKLG